ncbi:SDR family oxidoreductase [Falsiroseomonas ponticola]|uniref:SDR family oxidoreductase n=1 Tax=Falsiroseomonas ponticola TaxID=2786951 RepID=UPI0019338F97|nr:NAD-dependent epimerase/dehydratase family protein [Roseomonas ponticola]
MIAVIGASGRSGAALCRALKAAGRPFIPVVRNAAHWIATGISAEGVFADLEDARALRAALAGATVVVNTAHARFAPAVLAAAPEGARFVFLGSTRRFSQWRDAHGDGVRAGEAAFIASGRAGVMLHPTMIYGATGEDNVQRLAALLKRLPVAPLPGGGRALVQPIHQEDLSRCILAAIDIEWRHAEVMVVAGPEPLPYRDFLLAVAQAAGLKPPRVVDVPVALLEAVAPLTRWLPRVPRIGAEEVRRLVEDKAFPVTEMRERLGVVGRPLAEGLALTFRR